MTMAMTSASNNSLEYFLNKVWEEKIDERMAHYPILSDGPVTILTIIGLYLYFVKVWGPRFMEKRAPFNFPDLMICYNFSMVALSGWMFYEGCKYTKFGLSTWKCPNPVPEINDRETRRFLFVAWLFLFSKIIEFADTIFMVLRKKNNHISNLHVIHHSVVPLSVWLGLKFEPLGPNNFFPLVNSLVHTVMYSYYGLTAFNCGPSIRNKLNSFKPWMTRFQIFQFCLAILHCLVTVSRGCESLPKTFLVLNLGNALLFLALFFNFYRNCYRSKKSHHHHSK